LIGQVHPLVRFVKDQIRMLQEQEAVFYPAVSVRLDLAQAPTAVGPGSYVFITHRWMVEGVQTKEQLYFAAAPLGDAAALADEPAEQLIVRAATAGTDWLEARNVIDLPRAAEIASRLSAGAEAEYRAYVQRMRDENNDRADLQIATLDRHLRNQTEKLQTVREKHIAAGRDNLAKATARQIEILQQSVSLKRQKIERQRRLEPRHEEACLGVIKVSGE